MRTIYSMTGIENEIFRSLSKLRVDCPDCEGMYDDDQYSCALCGCEGGHGSINVVEYLREHPFMVEKILKP